MYDLRIYQIIQFNYYCIYIINTLHLVFHTIELFINKAHLRFEIEAL